MGIVKEECDEAIYWMELLVEDKFVRQDDLADLAQEANSLLSMLVASIKTPRSRKRNDLTISCKMNVSVVQKGVYCQAKRLGRSFGERQG